METTKGGRTYADEGHQSAAAASLSNQPNFQEKLEIMTQTYLHVQPCIHGGLSQPHRPMQWTKLEQTAVKDGYGRGERSENTVNSVRWNANGSRFLTGGKDGVIKLYDASGSGGAPVHLNEYKGHTGAISSVAFDCPESENYFASTSVDKSFRVWDTRKPKQSVHVERTREEIIRGIFSPR